MAPPSIPPPPPPPPPLNIPPSRARLQLAARLAMHQKHSHPSAARHEEDEDENSTDPFGDGEAEPADELSGNVAAEGGRGSWWRGVVRGGGRKEDDDSDDGDDEEFGDFAMAENDKVREDHVLLRPLAVHPTKESSRGLSGLWPFGSRDKNKNEVEKEGGGRPETEPAASEKSGNVGPAVEVKEATNRTSIEEPDEEEVVVGDEGLAGGASG